MVGACVLACTVFAQKPFREYPAWEYNNFPLPKDYMVPGEWTFARLMYPTTHLRIDWQSEFKRGFDWHEGNTNWTIDYPRSDRHLALAIRRLTRIDGTLRRAAYQSGLRTTMFSITPGSTRWKWATGS